MRQSHRQMIPHSKTIESKLLLAYPNENGANLIKKFEKFHRRSNLNHATIESLYFFHNPGHSINRA